MEKHEDLPEQIEADTVFVEVIDRSNGKKIPPQITNPIFGKWQRDYPFWRNNGWETVAAAFSLRAGSFTDP